MAPEKKDDPDARLAMVFLRYLRGWDQGGLARAARIAPSQVSVYDRGERAIPREVLERVAEAADFPRYLLDPLLRTFRSFRLAAERPPRDARFLADALTAELIALVRAAFDAVLPDLPPGEVATAGVGRPPHLEDREEAAELWSRLARRTPAQRLALIEEAEEYRSWALCERAAAESAAVAASLPRQALELAGLALRIAELAPGTEAWRWRLLGYAWAHVSEARRACGDLPGAEEALGRARRFWEGGAGGSEDSVPLEPPARLRSGASAIRGPGSPPSPG